MAQSTDVNLLAGRTIGLSYEANTNLFCRDLAEGIREAAAAQGVSVLVREYEDSVERQIADIAHLLDEGVDVLMISASDPVALGPIIREARQRGVPVFTVDRATADCPVVSHISSDNLQGGRIAADFLASLLENRGEVAIVGEALVSHSPRVWAATSVADRIRGFTEALVRHENVHLVAEIAGGASPQSACAATHDLLQRHPRLAGIFTVNDVTVQGVLRAVRAQGLEDRVAVVGYDATPHGCAEIMRGAPLRGEVAQFPTLIGHKAVELWANSLRGGPVPARLDVPVELVTPENVQQFSGAERLLRVRQGEVWTAGERVVFFPIRAYQMMLNEIHAASPDLLHHIVYRSGFVLGESIAEQVRELYPDPHDLLFVLLADMVRGGYGTFELLDLDLEGGHAKVRGYDLFEAALAPNLAWVRTPRCVDHYCSGRLAGYLTALFRRPAACEEISCQARGDADCQFVITAE